jgi:hypothetical protein
MKLTFASGLYDRMQALYTREVQPEGIELDFVVNENPRDIFNRTSARQEFDISEMSCSDYIARLSVQKEKTPFIALPVYPARCFRHGYITIDKRSRIGDPKDLAGRRIGLPRYTMTAAVWIRGILQHECGVDLSGVEWVEGQINDSGQHGEPGMIPLVRPAKITVNKTGKSLSQLIDESRLDAIVGTSLPESRRHNPDIVRLFPDFARSKRNTIGERSISRSCIASLAGEASTRSTHGPRQASTRPFAKRRRSRSEKCTTSPSPVTCCRGCTTIWTKSNGCSAAIRSSTESKRAAQLRGLHAVHGRAGDHPRPIRGGRSLRRRRTDGAALRELSMILNEHAQ